MKIAVHCSGIKSKDVSDSEESNRDIIAMMFKAIGYLNLKEYSEQFWSSYLNKDIIELRAIQGRMMML